MSSLSNLCPCCGKVISNRHNQPVYLQCGHIFCYSCLEIQKSKSEVCEDFLGIECHVCGKK